MPPPTREDLWKSGKDETVEVNQRALIDSMYTSLVVNSRCCGGAGRHARKRQADTSEILARYSGEHTSELLKLGGGMRS